MNEKKSKKIIISLLVNCEIEGFDRLLEAILCDYNAFDNVLKTSINMCPSDRDIKELCLDDLYRKAKCYNFPKK